ncbi:MAG: phosphotransferase [Gammaproteobacteria bacterium]|nr:phosphotransferase [Gammaproteobacteria bacterium]MDE0224955.1 phosphotransferase [Gammaproteobacteria bacterium]
MTAGPAIPGGGNAITVDWIQQALLAGSAVDVPRIRSVEVESIGTGLGLLADLFRCHLTYGDADGESQGDAAGWPRLPESVVVKLPSSELKSRRLCKRFYLYKRECDYYRSLAPNVPLRTPTLLYGDYEPRTDRFVLVLEDLRAMATADQIVGASAEQAKRAIRGIARLHGHYWNKVDQPELSGARRELSPQYRPLVQIVYLSNLLPTLRHFGEVFSAEMRRFAEAYGPRVAEHMGVLAAGPLTFCHGDYRLDNMFFGEGEEFAVIDWQVSAIQSSLYDVAYFLATSVATDIRREVERDALGEYHDIVRTLGAKDLTFEGCWELYRQNIAGRLITAVITCGGLDLNDERSYELAEISLRRTLTAIEDLEAFELIPARRRDLSSATVFSTLSRVGYNLSRAFYRP